MLIALFLISEYGSEIEDLEEVFAGIHPVLCAKFGVPYDPKDFEGALRTIEGSFVVISGTVVRFVNPSVRDYLARYLSDKALLSVLADGVPTLRGARNLFDHFMKQPGPTKEGITTFVFRFIRLCERFVTVEVWKRVPGETYRSRMYELPHSDRMDLLVNWWRFSNAEPFIAATQTIADRGRAALSAWEDGRKLPEILAGLRAAQALGEPTPSELISAVQAGVSGLLATDLDPDDITRILAAADEHEGNLPPTLFVEIEGAARRMMEDLEGISATWIRSPRWKTGARQSTRSPLGSMPIRASLSAPMPPSNSELRNCARQRLRTLKRVSLGPAICRPTNSTTPHWRAYSNRSVCRPPPCSRWTTTIWVISTNCRFSATRL